MDFDFTTTMDRHGKDALAVDIEELNGFNVAEVLREGFDRIPMWVADMNFPTAPTVQEEIANRLAHPAFGYFLPRQEYYNAIIDWQRKQNGVEGLSSHEIFYENGVLGGVATALRVLCSPGDTVLVHTPVYIGFRHVLEEGGYRMVESSLEKDAAGTFRMNLEDMEEKIRNNHVQTAIFCSPHNPTGRVWEREEIEAAMALFEEYDVKVLSDEIWSDLLLGDAFHIPTQSVSEDARERTVAFYAPSKTFNLAGMIGSYRIVYNRYMKQRLCKESARTHYNNMNVLSMYGLIGAYSKTGREWLSQLKTVLAANVDLACARLEKIEGISVSKPQGTYMLFVDCNEWLTTHNMTLDELLRKGMEVGVLWQDGRLFRGEGCIRMNLALPTARVEEAFDRLEAHVFGK